MAVAHDDPVRRAYDHIASQYDEFTWDDDYERWLGALLPKAEACGLRKDRVLDVACGTGKSFLPLLEAGWEVSGCDISPAMLEVAKAKVGERADLRIADMRQLSRFGSFSLILCLCDGINYLTGGADLRATFCGMRRNLAPDGIVLFDCNTLRSYSTFFASTATVDTHTAILTWRGGGDGSAAAGETVRASFEITRDGSVTTADHVQRHFSRDEVIAALRSAGLTASAVFGHGLDVELEQPSDESRHTKTIYIAGHA
jgi:SAM-dependent methyltransferase